MDVESQRFCLCDDSDCIKEDGVWICVECTLPIPESSKIIEASDGEGF